MLADFFFNDTATTEIYTLSLHDALPISPLVYDAPRVAFMGSGDEIVDLDRADDILSGSKVATSRSEEHTSELQSPCNLVCRLLLEKKQRIRGVAPLGHLRLQLHLGPDSR